MKAASSSKTSVFSIKLHDFTTQKNHNLDNEHCENLTTYTLLTPLLPSVAKNQFHHHHNKSSASVCFSSQPHSYALVTGFSKQSSMWVALPPCLYLNYTALTGGMAEEFRTLCNLDIETVIKTAQKKES
jgi:hypothetical protein